MRDGNVSLALAHILGATRLKPTYEGWKLGGWPASILSAPGLKPTYEGWKLRKTVQFVNVGGV